jgi:hypothetical protein
MTPRCDGIKICRRRFYHRIVMMHYIAQCALFGNGLLGSGLVVGSADPGDVVLMIVYDILTRDKTYQQ